MKTRGRNERRREIFLRNKDLFLFAKLYGVPKETSGRHEHNAGHDETVHETVT